MRFGHIEHFVTNPMAARDFYVDVLGFEEVAVQGDQFVWVKLGDVEILLRQGVAQASSDDYASAQSAIVIYTADLAADSAALRERGLVFRGTDGSDSCLTFTDPDGHWFQLAENP